MKRLNKTGDTIVEVLISIAIISTVLAGAYVTSNNSLRGSRQAQERGEGTKFAEEQLERLKELANNPATHDLVFATVIGDYFCIDQTLSIVAQPAVPDDAQTDMLPVAPANGGYPEACIKPLYTGSFNYHQSIERTADNLFSIRVRWVRAGGDGNEEVKLTYRLWP